MKRLNYGTRSHRIRPYRAVDLSSRVPIPDHLQCQLATAIIIRRFTDSLCQAVRQVLSFLCIPVHHDSLPVIV